MSLPVFDVCLCQVKAITCYNRPIVCSGFIFTFQNKTISQEGKPLHDTWTCLYSN